MTRDAIEVDASPIGHDFAAPPERWRMQGRSPSPRRSRGTTLAA
jgi:hypothetical protein